MPATVADNLTEVRASIARLCDRHRRPAADVQLLAVSKTRPPEDIATALAMGQEDFGENYLQEATEKIQALQGRGIRWHFIGAIQSNKTRPIAEQFDWVHTVASRKVAERLSHQRPTGLAPLQILIQVNIDDEPTKAGVAPAELEALVAAILPLPGIQLRGLMAIPAAHDSLDAQRQPLARLRQMRDHIRARFGNGLPAFDQLSMGMSADMEAAIIEGSTWLRVGTAIFGARSPKPGT